MTRFLLGMPEGGGGEQAFQHVCRKLWAKKKKKETENNLGHILRQEVNPLYWICFLCKQRFHKQLHYNKEAKGQFRTTAHRRLADGLVDFNTPQSNREASPTLDVLTLPESKHAAGRHCIYIFHCLVKS